LRRFIQEDAKRFERLVSEVCANGILEEDPEHAAQLKMSHKSFAEYFVADTFFSFRYPEKINNAEQVDNIGSGLKVDFEYMHMSREAAKFVCEMVYTENVAQISVFRNTMTEKLDTIFHRAPMALLVLSLPLAGLPAVFLLAQQLRVFNSRKIFNLYCLEQVHEVGRLRRRWGETTLFGILIEDFDDIRIDGRAPPPGFEVLRRLNMRMVKMFSSLGERRREVGFRYYSEGLPEWLAHIEETEEGGRNGAGRHVRRIHYCSEPRDGAEDGQGSV
jgi:hypothetical protein